MFAFLGDEKSLDTIDGLYRNPREDWIDERSWISILTASSSFADVPGLEREMRGHMPIDKIEAIARAGESGRILVVSTTNVDTGVMHTWDMVEESERAVKTSDPSRVHALYLASAAIPAVFPPREIDGGLQVDGGVSGNILYGVRFAMDDPFIVTWDELHPGAPEPKVRYWVLFNNQVKPAPKIVLPNWADVAMRSLNTLTRASTITALRHLFTREAAARLRHSASIEVRYVAVPDDWVPPTDKAFDRATMNALADLGESMGADAASWITKSP